MGKRVRKVPPEKLRPVSYDRMAESLVDRCLASPLILDRPRRSRLRPQADNWRTDAA